MHCYFIIIGALPTAYATAHTCTCNVQLAFFLPPVSFRVHTGEDAQLEVGYLTGSASWPSALDCNPWNFPPPSLRENAVESVLGTPHTPHSRLTNPGPSLTNPGPSLTNPGPSLTNPGPMCIPPYGKCATVLSSTLLLLFITNILVY